MGKREIPGLVINRTISITIKNKHMTQETSQKTKRFHFNIQSKGGTGKSMLTYLQALKEQANKKSFFIDFDSSVKSSSQQLKFLQGKTPPRFATMSLLNDLEKLDRQLLLENLEELSNMDYTDFYLDFGAPESDQLPALFSIDYSVRDLMDFEKHLQAKFKFNIIVAGSSSYVPCTNYLQKVVDILKGEFEVNIYVNESTFLGSSELIDEISNFAKIETNKINLVKLYNSLDSTTLTHKKILQKISEGHGLETYTFIAKMNIHRQIAKI
jgi:cellulose biosynthesis protein BcsQ